MNQIAGLPHDFGRRQLACGMVGAGDDSSTSPGRREPGLAVPGSDLAFRQVREPVAHGVGRLVEGLGHFGHRVFPELSRGGRQRARKLAQVRRQSRIGSMLLLVLPLHLAHRDLKLGGHALSRGMS